MGIPPSFGGAPYTPQTKVIIRLLLKGCTNRPFFHIAVQDKSKHKTFPVIEQLGSYDPIPNKFNEKLVAINFDRLEHWLRIGADVDDPVKKLLGLSGYFPVHPDSFKDAFLKRHFLTEELERLKIEAAKITSNNVEANAEGSEKSLDNSSSEPSVESEDKNPKT